MKQRKLYEQLISLDFTPNDARVYLALLETGDTSAGALIKKTDLHRNVVYTALDHLEARKLVSRKHVRGASLFMALDPARLSHEFSSKAEVAEVVSAELDALRSRGVHEISVYQGNEEYLSLLTGLLSSMPKKSTKYVMGTGGESFMNATMRPIWKPYHKVASERKISIRMIAYESQRSALEHDVKNPPIYSVRYLSDELENPSGIHIYPEIDTALNIIYSNETDPVIAIRIQHSSLVAGYLNLFNRLWEMGVG